MSAQPEVDVERLLAEELAKGQPLKKLPPLAALAREFRAAGEDRYLLTVPDLGVTLEIDRLRRDHNELIGEFTASCELPGARTVNGALSVGDLNLSSVRARSDRAKVLDARANVKGLDWTGLLEEFAQRVVRAERTGQPAVDLRNVPRPNLNESTIEADGFVVPKDHPTILFGDGGTCKSMFALRFAGRLSEKQVTVAYFDWELAAEDHRDRLERLFGEDMPRILYCRCERPLTYEADRLRRIVRENDVRYSIYDSVAFACDGPPESAEIAGKYFRAARQIGGGSLHIAHITKGENADKKPFGSTFWHNGARSTWFVQLAEGSAESDNLQVGLFNRKSNLGRLRPPIGYAIRFEEEHTLFRRTDVADSPELAGQLSVKQRMIHLLKRRSMTVTAIAEELDVEVNTVTQTVNRGVKKGGLFIVLDGQNTNRRVGLAARDNCHEGNA
jgi:hypothetical protein